MNPIEYLVALGMQGEPHAVHSGAQSVMGAGEMHKPRAPIDGAQHYQLAFASSAQVAAVVQRAQQAFEQWRQVPAPVRGEFVRQFGNVLRQEKAALGALVTLEVGKSQQEGLGEVQEMIDICDFAVGLSRGLEGKVFASERPKHRLTEQWHPLGPVGVISAFNFPVAVWAWNAAIAWVCGDPVVWKPSEKAPLCAVACQLLVQRALHATGFGELVLSSLLVGGSDVGEALARSVELPLISATGSVRMGRAVGQAVATRLGRALLELGGNNAAIVAPSADIDLALRGVVFAAVGTAGQRCTSLRRLILHESLYTTFKQRLRVTYQSLTIGDPRDATTLLGPLIDEGAYVAMQHALQQARAQGGVVTGGERVLTGVPAGGYYVRPALVEISPEAEVVAQETFAPLLYVHRYRSLDEAIAINNAVPQGLSSAIFTRDMQEAELFCSAVGSDCGIANVNIGTSGAEIGGAFGGEKDTGGGRESGSDAWKAYMRRATNTVNFGTALPLAQGIAFELPT
jgi:aldehyde dehydrogenase (NAD+)